MTTFDDQKKIILDYLDKRRVKYDLFIQEFKKEESSAEPAARGHIFRVANLLLDELRTDNGVTKNLLASRPPKISILFLMLYSYTILQYGTQ